MSSGETCSNSWKPFTNNLALINLLEFSILEFLVSINVFLSKLHPEKSAVSCARNYIYSGKLVISFFKCYLLHCVPFSFLFMFQRFHVLFTFQVPLSLIISKHIVLVSRSSVLRSTSDTKIPSL